MANSKFSGVGFTSGVTATDNSVFAGYEVIGPGQGENRRWTSKELFSGTYNLNGGGLKFFFTQGQQCRFNHNGFDATGSGSVGATQNIVINADTGNNGQDISLRINGSERMNITNANTTHANPVKFNGGIKDTNNQLGSSGQVLSSTGSTVEWINAGGSTPTLQAVVNASAPLPLVNDQGGNTGWIEFREGNTTNRLTIGRDGGTGPFGIACSQGTFSIRGATFQSFALQTGPSSSRALIFQYPTSGNSVAEFTNSMDVRLSPTTAFKCGPQATAGTAGQVLKSTGTSVEWISAKDLDFSGLPTSQPATSGLLWNDGGTVKVAP
jgi:hypothetical protein